MADRVSDLEDCFYELEHVSFPVLGGRGVVGGHLKRVPEILPPARRFWICVRSGSSLGLYCSDMNWPDVRYAGMIWEAGFVEVESTRQTGVGIDDDSENSVAFIILYKADDSRKGTPGAFIYTIGRNVAKIIMCWK